MSGSTSQANNACAPHGIAFCTGVAQNPSSKLNVVSIFDHAKGNYANLMCQYIYELVNRDVPRSFCPHQLNLQAGGIEKTSL